MKSIEARSHWISAIIGFAALLILSAVLVGLPWIRMWLLAAGVYFGFKAFVLMKTPSPADGTLEWLLFCPTLNLTGFLRKSSVESRHALRLALSGLLNLALGAPLLWIVARHFAETPMAAAWVGMTGLIFMMHFGGFHLITAFWMRRGRCVEPLMKCPVAAVSLADFWGRRWNTAFRDAMNLLVFRPVAGHWNARTAQWLVFLLSGLLHELVVSVPAGGGWGGPTLYFLLQAAGMDLHRRLRIPRGIASRLWALAFLLAPVGLLFHTPFIHRVMLPFFQTLKALP